MDDWNATSPLPPPLDAPTDLGANTRGKISSALNTLLADMFTLFIKTKNFHWHVSGPHFHDYHLLLYEQANQILGTTDAIAGRVRKLGAVTLRSVGQISRLQRLLDNDAEYVTPFEMLTELREDNQQLAAHLRETHGICEEHGDVASTNLLESWIDQADLRVWHLFEAGRQADTKVGR
jgi:starvation-inducible DNA-binding protein